MWDKKKHQRARQREETKTYIDKAVVEMKANKLSPSPNIAPLSLLDNVADDARDVGAGARVKRRAQLRIAEPSNHSKK